MEIESEYEDELVHTTPVGQYVFTALMVVSEEWEQVDAKSSSYCECVGRCHHQRWEPELQDRSLISLEIDNVVFIPLLPNGQYSEQVYPVPAEALEHLRKAFEEEALDYAERNCTEPKESEFRDWAFSRHDE